MEDGRIGISMGKVIQWEAKATKWEVQSQKDPFPNLVSGAQFLPIVCS